MCNEFALLRTRPVEFVHVFHAVETPPRVLVQMLIPDVKEKPAQ